MRQLVHGALYVNLPLVSLLPLYPDTLLDTLPLRFRAPTLRLVLDGVVNNLIFVRSFGLIKYPHKTYMLQWWCCNASWTLRWALFFLSSDIFWVECDLQQLGETPIESPACRRGTEESNNGRFLIFLFLLVTLAMHWLDGGTATRSKIIGQHHFSFFLRSLWSLNFASYMGVPHQFYTPLIWCLLWYKWAEQVTKIADARVFLMPL